LWGSVDSFVVATEGDREAHLRTFMIADVRGYTTYTRSHGDEAAGDLAAQFASVVRAATEAADGRLVETRGG
jgi:class 3 adenylate cyclase